MKNQVEAPTLATTTPSAATGIPAESRSQKLTPDQLAQLDIARRSDGKNDDWVQLYLEEFPVEEQRDVAELRTYIDSGEVILHETREPGGKLLTWSMSQDYPAPADSDEPSFWLGCWTVTRRSAQSTGVGRMHFAKVIEELKRETPGYIGRLTEIEATHGLPPNSQQVRRAKFYKSLGMQELDIPYEIPMFQPPESTAYVEQAKLGAGIAGQLLIALFDSAPITLAQISSIVSRIYQKGYDVSLSDQYIAARLQLFADKDSYLMPIRTGS